MNEFVFVVLFVLLGVVIRLFCLDIFNVVFIVVFVFFVGIWL